MTEDDELVLILNWSSLDDQSIDDRLSWLRNSLIAGQDWGYCIEKSTCVIKNTESSILYKLTWFTPGQQRELTASEIRDVYQNSNNNDIHVTSDDISEWIGFTNLPTKARR